MASGKREGAEVTNTHLRQLWRRVLAVSVHALSVVARDLGPDVPNKLNLIGARRTREEEGEPGISE